MNSRTAVSTSRLTELYTRFSHGDATVIDELFSDDVAAHLLGDTLLAADYTGKRALREFIARTIEMNHSPQYRFEIEDVLEGEKYISFVGNVTVHAKGPAQASVIRTHDILRLDDEGRAAEMWSMVL
jgi:ketosteroid isomerase-like protein